ncbi:ATP-binding protein [Streptomyces gramineus]|uniref:sensor histidine kinase n=1 Tax=Streptomyces gramineus TaxID=910542 RepID=UPI00398BA182
MSRIHVDERGRLTALYTVLILLAGGVLVASVYVVLRQGLTAVMTSTVLRAPVSDSVGPSPAGTTLSSRPSRVSGDAQDLVTDLVTATTHRLLLVCVVSLLVFATISVFMAWWMAGRVLRPVGVITDRARQLSGSNLHERIRLDAPPGEFKRLADTFDAMLDRMERVMAAQQRFAANAAHELRTPLALQRAAAEIGLGDNPEPARVAYIREELIGISARSERLIDGLLLLATSQRGPEHREDVALHTLAEKVAMAFESRAADMEVALAVEAHTCEVEGDSVLLERLVHNLVANAVAYNRPGGRVTLSTGRDGLIVANTGPDVPAASVPRLFEPFHRAAARRTAPGEGAGLGLSIVAAIADAHGTRAYARANPGGGLTVTVPLPTSAGSSRT